MQHIWPLLCATMYGAGLCLYYIVHDYVSLTKVGLSKVEQEDVTESDFRIAVF